MQPSRRHCLWASLALLAFLSSASQASADTLTITSSPPGATVQLDGIVVGTTPYHASFPGGYFHKTHTVFGSRLDHAMMLRLSLDGYATEQMNLTEGPFEWIAVTGRREGTYFLLKTNHVNVTLSAGALQKSVSEANTNGRSLHTFGVILPGDSADGTDASGNVTVDSDPAGAEIYADGEFIGQTPSTVRISAGSHRIEVRSPGRRPWTRTLQVIRDSQVTLHAVWSSAGRANNSDSSSGSP